MKAPPLRKTSEPSFHGCLIRINNPDVCQYPSTITHSPQSNLGLRGSFLGLGSNEGSTRQRRQFRYVIHLMSPDFSALARTCPHLGISISAFC
jgi:hypothetical protein